MRIRASAVPGIMQCPASKYPPKMSIRTDSEPAHVGNAVHAVMASIVDKSYSWDVPRACSEWPDVDAKEVSILVGMARKIWAKYEPLLDVVEVETEHSFVISADWTLTGHMDVAGWHIGEDGTLVVIDWKTGRVDSDYREQLLSYAYLLLQKYIEVKRFKIVTVWVRDNRTVIDDITIDMLKDYEQRLLEVTTISDEYHPGDVCLYCNSRHECEAQKEMSRAAVQAFTAIDSDSALSPATIGALYHQVKIVKKACKDYDDAIKHTVATYGPVSLPNGDTLDFREEPRDKIRLNLDILREHLDEEAIFKVTSITKTALGKELMAVAPSGEKGKFKMQVLDELRAAGSIESSVIQKLIVKKGGCNE